MIRNIPMDIITQVGRACIDATLQAGTGGMPQAAAMIRHTAVHIVAQVGGTWVWPEIKIWLILIGSVWLRFPRGSFRVRHAVFLPA